MFKKLLWVFFISMVPIIELRGSIPVGCGLGLDAIPNLICAMLGNLLPVPFILLFIPQILDFMEKHRIFPRIVGWVQRKAHRGVEKMSASAEEKGDDQHRIPWGALIALFAFVAVPLPGTGAWTGSLIAATFGMKKRYSIPVIILGVLVAGILVTLISYGALSALEFLL